MRIKTKELRRVCEFDAGFFVEFARQCRQDRFTFLDAPAGKVPAGPVGVADQQHGIVGAQNHALCAQRQAA